jgi:hypothetical protein
MENRARAPTDEDRRLVQGIIDRHVAELPPGVRRIDVEFGEDWTGYPAAYIKMFVDKDLKPTNDKIKELNKFLQILHDEIIDAGAGFWPYSRTLVDQG